MDRKKNVTKEETIAALAYLEVVAENNSENERFVSAVKTVRERLAHLESCFAAMADWIRETE